MKIFFTVPSAETGTHEMMADEEDKELAAAVSRRGRRRNSRIRSHSQGTGPTRRSKV